MNLLPRSIYPPRRPDSVTERGVRKSLVEDSFFCVDLLGCAATKSVDTQLVWLKVVSFPESMTRIQSILATRRGGYLPLAGRRFGRQTELLGKETIEETLRPSLTSEFLVLQTDFLPA